MTKYKGPPPSEIARRVLVGEITREELIQPGEYPTFVLVYVALAIVLAYKSKYVGEGQVVVGYSALLDKLINSGVQAQHTRAMSAIMQASRQQHLHVTLSAYKTTRITPPDELLRIVAGPNRATEAFMAHVREGVTAAQAPTGAADVLQDEVAMAADMLMARFSGQPREVCLEVARRLIAKWGPLPPE